MSILDQVKNAPMGRWQIGAITFCLAINLADGFDLLVITYAGLLLTREWGLEPSQLGVLLSVGMIGLACGSMFLAPLADRFGRRRLVLGGLLLATVGMTGSALSQNLGQLIAARVVTGLAIGLMAVCLLVLAAEYSNDRRRGLSVGMVTTGFAVGGILAGGAASLLIEPYGWRSLFVVGAVLTAVLLLLGLRYLPESIDYLLAARPPDALPRLNRILVSMGRTPVEELPPAPVSPTKVAVEELFRGRNAARTLLIWLALFIAQGLFYFASLWTPTLLLQSGLSTQQGISGGLLYSVGSLAGAVLFGLLAIWVEPRKLVIVFFAVSALSLLAYSFSLTALAAAMIMAVVVGILVNGTTAGLGVVVTIIYPAAARATGVGVAVAVSRLGAVLSPLFAGFLVQASWTPTSMFQIYALPALVGAAVCVLLLWVTNRPATAVSARQPATPDAEGTASQA